MIPSLRDAASDQRIDGATAKVLLHLAGGALDTVEFSAVKVASVASALHMKDVTVYRAMNTLVECGYLRRSGTDRVRTYRLVYARVA